MKLDIPMIITVAAALVTIYFIAKEMGVIGKCS